MKSSNPGNQISSRASLAAACVALLLLVAAADAQVVVNIVEPALNATASGSLYVRATVSSVFELSTVTAQVEGQQVNLKYSQPLNAWTNSIPLTGLSFGSHTLVVNAQEFFGGTAQAMRSFRKDDPPTLTVHEPINGTVVNGKVYISAEATDDAGEIVIKAYFPTTPQRTPAVIATNRLEGVFSVAALTGGSQVTFEAIDSGGNKRMIGRQIVLEPSSNLTTIAVSPGNIFDFDATRFLYSVQEDIVLAASPSLAPWPYSRPEPRVLSRQTGLVTSSRNLFESWIEGPLDIIHPSFIESGLLGDTGCLLWTGNLVSNIERTFLGWDGNVANFSLVSLSTLGNANLFKVVGTTTIGNRRFTGSEGPKLVLQDIVKSNVLHEVSFPLNTFFTGDLGPNLDLVYAVSNSVYRSRPVDLAEPYTNRTTTVLSTNVNGANLHIATDGTNVSYDVQVANPLGVNIQLITPAGEETLATWPDFIGPDFRLNNAWAAYTKPGASGQTQVWTRSPTGTQQQRTFFNASSALESLGPNGEVTFIYNNARYVGLPGVLQPMWVNSGQGRVRWDGGKLLVILGRSVLEFRMGQLQCTALAGGSTRLTFNGPNGFSYAVQGSPDLEHWTNLWAFAHTTGTISWTNPPASGHNFYRAVTAPAP